MDPSVCIESGLQPLQTIGPKHHHIEATGRRDGHRQQIVARRKDDASSLCGRNAGRSPTMVTVRPGPDFHEHGGGVRRLHNQVDFATTTARRAKVARQQPQTLRKQIPQRKVFCRVAALLGGLGFCRLQKEYLVGALFQEALTAARQAAGAQNYPTGALYVVATPIGNLADISLRALHVLALADTVACEDTRHTQQMLRAYGIDKSAAQLLALHHHNEVEASALAIDRVRSGQRVVYVSDAGTPGISDPGARLVDQCRGADLRTVPIPGASSVTTLLSVAGIAGSAPIPDGFCFFGFLPSKAAERNQAIQRLQSQEAAVVLLEAPHRIEATARALGVLGDRPITIGRELTKQFEEISTQPAAGLANWFAQDANRLRGEFALVIHPSDVRQDQQDGPRVLRLLLTELPLKTAVKLACDITGEPRNALYDLALAWKQE